MHSLRFKTNIYYRTRLKILILYAHTGCIMFSALADSYLNSFLPIVFKLPDKVCGRNTSVEFDCHPNHPRHSWIMVTGLVKCPDSYSNSFRPSTFKLAASVCCHNISVKFNCQPNLRNSLIMAHKLLKYTTFSVSGLLFEQFSFDHLQTCFQGLWPWYLDRVWLPAKSSKARPNFSSRIVKTY